MNILAYTNLVEPIWFFISCIFPQKIYDFVADPDEDDLELANYLVENHIIAMENEAAANEKESDGLSTLAEENDKSKRMNRYVKMGKRKNAFVKLW